MFTFSEQTLILPPNSPCFLTHFFPIHLSFFKTVSLFWTLRLHVEQAGCPTDTTLWERLHCDKGAGWPNGGCRAVQIPLREAQNVRRWWNTQPLPWLRGSRGRNGEFKSYVRGPLLAPHTKAWHQIGSVTQAQFCWQDHYLSYRLQVFQDMSWVFVFTSLSCFPSSSRYSTSTRVQSQWCLSCTPSCQLSSHVWACWRENCKWGASWVIGNTRNSLLTRLKDTPKMTDFDCSTHPPLNPIVCCLRHVPFNTHLLHCLHSFAFWGQV